jgi:hypothetical protein
MEQVLNKNPFDDVADACARIPHLDLMTPFDVTPLYREYDRLDEGTWRPYQTKFAPLAGLLAANWHGASLVGPNGDTYADLTEKIQNNNEEYSITELGKLCPNMMKVIDHMGGEASRCRVMVVKAGGRLNWHSHVYDGMPSTDPNKKYEIVVHVPIVSPHGFKYSVISVEDYRTKDLERENIRIYNANYPPGAAWMFNSVHMHNVFNHSPHDRVSIMMYLNLKNIKTFNIVSQAVYQYKGILI